MARFGTALLILALALAVSATHRNQREELRRRHHRHHHHSSTGAPAPPSAAPEVPTGTWAPQPNATHPPSGSTGAFDAEKDSLRRGHHRHHHHNATGAPVSATPEAPTGTWAPFYNVTDQPSASTGSFNAGKDSLRRRHHRHHHHNSTSEPVSVTPEAPTGTWAPFYNVTDQPSGSTGAFDAEKEEARRRHHRHHHSTDAGTPGWQFNASTPAWPQEGSTGGFDAEKDALRRGHHHHHNSTGSPDASTPAWQPEPSTGAFDAEKDSLRRGHHRHHHHASTDAGTPAWQFNATTPNAPSWPPQQGSTGAFNAAELRRKHRRHHHHNSTSVPPTPAPVVDSTPW